MLLGETALTAAQIAALDTFVSGGGGLVAMRPVAGYSLLWDTITTGNGIHTFGARATDAAGNAAAASGTTVTVNNVDATGSRAWSDTPVGAGRSRPGAAGAQHRATPLALPTSRRPA